MKTHPPLPPGYSEIPPGKLANIAVCLEMTERPVIEFPDGAGRLSFNRWRSPGLTEYRQLFRAVGENWLWVSRLEMPDNELLSAIANPDIETFFVETASRKIGFLELDFRQPGECEIVYCGLVEDAIGQGVGRFLMANALAAAWSRDIRRVWLHTCNFDHPAAYGFYCRSGFQPFKFLVEVIDDPRCSGIFSKTAAPHIPFLPV